MEKKRTLIENLIIGKYCVAFASEEAKILLEREKMRYPTVSQERLEQKVGVVYTHNM